ncbi:Sec-independent protein translocase subunit TatA [Yinghuangia sp. ASG 101]|uniref:Sec-independent protein translocase subunit TatA n=1 Tax=Yinghuangia sp. ASG 101 TaxID=2896848 RepID=UPI001E5E09AB|nr:Sec-independent protein translocase subunit TatA [Yinghuangia sp. ASG 101]UGQ10703.1 Sec-independent protein translocase subunit TatA [Yinghuangia sp. ASG 101]
MFGRLGPTEIILILVIVVLLFGAKKLPDTARALGRSMRILKSEAKAMKTDDATANAAKSDAGTSETTETPRTIQAAPGEVSQARPVGEPDANRR